MADIEIKAEDIVFDCPNCGKSLAIDPRGAGLTITCPDCENGVQVPIPEVLEEGAADTAFDMNDTMDAEHLADALATSQAKVQELVERLEEVNRRRNYLEHLRAENLSRFEVIGKELTNISGAMDRIIDALQGARNGQ